MPAIARKAPPLHFTSKTCFLAGDELVVCDRLRPLRGMYFLGAGSAADLVFERLKPSQALMQLVAHSFLLDVEERQSLSAQFSELCALVQVVPCFQLDYPRRFEDLPRLRLAVIEHAQRNVPDSASALS